MSPVQCVRNYNQRPLKELCAKVIKHNYISNVNTVLESEFVVKLSPSEMSYLTRTREKHSDMLSIVLYTLSLCSSTFTPISSKLLGKYAEHMVHGPTRRQGKGGGKSRRSPPLENPPQFILMCGAFLLRFSPVFWGVAPAPPPPYEGFWGAPMGQGRSGS